MHGTRDHTTDGCDQPSVLDVALDAFDSALNSLIETVEGSGLDQLNAAEKVAAWQRFETSRNRLPLAWDSDPTKIVNMAR